MGEQYGKPAPMLISKSAFLFSWMHFNSNKSMIGAVSTTDPSDVMINKIQWKQCQTSPSLRKKVTVCHLYVLSPSALTEGEKQRWHPQISYVKNNHIHIWHSLNSVALDNWKYQIWFWQCSESTETPHFHMFLQQSRSCQTSAIVWLAAISVFSSECTLNA